MTKTILAKNKLSILLTRNFICAKIVELLILKQKDGRTGEGKYERSEVVRTEGVNSLRKNKV